MATYYVDLENGNDTNNGTSFALRKKNLSSVTAAAGGDVIRVMGSPDPQDTTYTGIWRSGKWANNRIVTISALNTASPRVATSTAHGLVTGDFIYFNANTTSGAHGIWQVTVINANSFSLDGSGGGTSTSGSANYYTDRIIQMPSGAPHFKSIASGEQLGRTAWVASSNATAALLTNGMNGSPSDSIGILLAFTTGKVAYKTVPNISLTGFTRLSFWANQPSGTSPGNNYTLRLCSDTIGNTLVAEVQFTTPQNGVWTHFEFDLSAFSGNFGNNINSVGLYVTTDRGAQSLSLNNIIVSKPRTSADSISHATIISKSNSAVTDQEWYGIQGITEAGHLVLSPGFFTQIPTGNGMFYGTTESATIYKREPILIGNPATTVMTSSNSGTGADNRVTISGGWDRTDMSTQTGETWVQRYGGTSNSIGLTLTGNWVKVEKICGARLSNLINISSGGQQGLEIYVPGCASVANVFTCPAPLSIQNGSYFELGYATSSNTSFSWSNNDAVSFKELKVTSLVSGSIGVADKNTIGRIACANQAIQAGDANTTIEITDGIYGCARPIFLNSIYPTTVTRLGNVENTSTGLFGGGVAAVGDLRVANGSITNAPHITNAVGRVFLKNVTTTGITTPTAFQTGFEGRRFPSTLSTDTGTFTRDGFWQKQTSVVRTAGSSAWQISPTEFLLSAANPLVMPLGKVAVVADSPVTVSVWVRRTNTALTLKLVVPGGQVAGMSASPIEDSITASANTWEELTVSFTPTQSGVVEFEIDAFGGTTHSGYVDDLTVSQ
jgi:hypothetical protein